MSQTHTRAPIRSTPTKLGWGFKVAVTAGVLLTAGLIAFGPQWSPPIEESHEIARGQVLETRIAVAGTRDSYYGGSILYRIEAHVRYDLHGLGQDRWMPASEVSSNRDTLALRLVKPPGTCEVYWVPGHPENPQCLLK
jgi:hypothetical protein